LKKKINRELSKEINKIYDNITKTNDLKINEIDDPNVIDDVILSEHITLNKDRVFNYVSKSWQTIKSKQLKLQFVKSLHIVGKRKDLGEPTAYKGYPRRWKLFISSVVLMDNRKRK